MPGLSKRRLYGELCTMRLPLSKNWKTESFRFQRVKFWRRRDCRMYSFLPKKAMEVARIQQFLPPSPRLSHQGSIKILIVNYLWNLYIAQSSLNRSCRQISISNNRLPPIDRRCRFSLNYSCRSASTAWLIKFLAPFLNNSVKVSTELSSGCLSETTLLFFVSYSYCWLVICSDNRPTEYVTSSFCQTTEIIITPFALRLPV